MVKRLKKKGRLKSPQEESSNRQYQFKICLWLALGKTTSQIIALLQERLGIKTTPQNIDHNYRHGKKWKKIIQYLRTRYLNNIAHMPIAKKAYRLAMLQESIEEALTWHVKSKGRYGTVYEKKIGNVPQLVNEARKEIEGEKGVEIHQHITVEKKEEKIAKLRRYYSKAEERSASITG